MKRLLLLFLLLIFIQLPLLKAVDFSVKEKSIIYTNAIKVLENYQTIINQMGLYVVNNVEKVLAIELMSAAQALDFRRPAKTAPVLEKLYIDFRKQVSFNEVDRVLHDDMIHAIKFIQNYSVD